MTPKLSDLKQRGIESLIKGSKTDLNGCIFFNGYVNKSGYGEFQFRLNHLKYKIEAHRAIYMLTHEVELTCTEVVMHSCDNPPCINPSHLSKGTHQDNVSDRVSKGRSAKGEMNGRFTHGLYSKYANLPR